MKINRSGGQGKTLQERAVSHHDGSIKPQSRLRAIPSHELFDSVFVAPTGMCRRQHVEHGDLRLLQFWHGETRTTGRLAALYVGQHGEAAPSTAYQSCVHTEPSAKSEEFKPIA